MPQATIGVIGGTGLYRMDGMTDVEEVSIHTPFGDPSDVITIGKVSGVSMAFLPRHGEATGLAPRKFPFVLICGRSKVWVLNGSFQ
jgi:5'-methylthioadenosine phosphorylase